jgi:hypothetical protein
MVEVLFLSHRRQAQCSPLDSRLSACQPRLYGDSIWPTRDHMGSIWCAVVSVRF